jgi:hypothetical protein
MKYLLWDELWVSDYFANPHVNILNIQSGALSRLARFQESADYEFRRDLGNCNQKDRKR